MFVLENGGALWEHYRKTRLAPASREETTICEHATRVYSQNTSWGTVHRTHDSSLGLVSEANSS